jgi:predicted  nucleic acid-binding Zn-ribbon protein
LKKTTDLLSQVSDLKAEVEILTQSS